MKTVRLLLQQLCPPLRLLLRRGARPGDGLACVPRLRMDSAPNAKFFCQVHLLPPSANSLASAGKANCLIGPESAGAARLRVGMRRA